MPQRDQLHAGEARRYPIPFPQDVSRGGVHSFRMLLTKSRRISNTDGFRSRFVLLRLRYGMQKTADWRRKRDRLVPIKDSDDEKGPIISLRLICREGEDL